MSEIEASCQVIMEGLGLKLGRLWHLHNAMLKTVVYLYIFSFMSNSSIGYFI